LKYKRGKGKEEKGRRKNLPFIFYFNLAKSLFCVTIEIYKGENKT